jgi:hypothetical protein
MLARMFEQILNNLVIDLFYLNCCSNADLISLRTEEWHHEQSLEVGVVDVYIFCVRIHCGEIAEY